jgi:hypothetical protein
MVRAVVGDEWFQAEAAHRFNATPKTVSKWIEPFEAKGVEGLRDRSRGRSPRRNEASPAMCTTVEALRRQRYAGAQIAAEIGVSPAALSRILRASPQSQPAVGAGAGRAGSPLSARRLLRDPPHRHQEARQVRSDRSPHTGNRTGQSNTRGAGWEYMHLAIDDHSRLAYSEVLPDEKRASCLGFLFNALRFFRGLGVKVQRIMTDNGVSFRSFRCAKALRPLRIKASAHQALHPQDQRKGRALRPNQPARMGPCPRLQHLR